ncbi:MaoC/PaaZ C-terminal domain-containing protein [Salipiger sp.]|uniref:MaoC/PaaZ C-terminal domain-containing protein n=1 Tax=Salipiger sp. TaxID=2078585 RepID=UPI003A986404
MAIDADRLLARDFPVQRIELTPERCILYALGIGLGRDATDPAALRYLYEDGLAVFPTMSAIIGFPGFWAREPDTGIDWKKLVHGEQSMTMHAPLPVGGIVRAENRISALYDKGEGRGAILIQERRLYDDATDTPLATLEQLTLLRGDGGFSNGDPARAGRPVPAPGVPERAPDRTCRLTSRGDAALIYRLSGDLNPLHADPAVAAAAGFDRPILHGMATLAMACDAVARTCLDGDADRIASLRLRFSAPFHPGETLRTEIWNEGGGHAFRAYAEERGVKVLDCGRIELHG